VSYQRRYAIARPYRLSLDTFAELTSVHPELVRRLVALGLLETSRDSRGDLWFHPSQVRAMARIQRLHKGLNLDYAALGLVIDLLDRITRLERAQRHPSPGGVRPWT
jgi:hypothetical protein